MKIGILNVGKSKLHLAAAVLFALSAGLQIAPDIASLGTPGSSAAFYANLMRNLPIDLLVWLVPILFCISCISLYISKPRKSAVAMMCLASAIYIILLIIDTAQTFKHNIDDNIDYLFAVQIYVIFTTLLSMAPFVLLIVTVFGVLKTKTPLLVFLIVILLISLLEIILYLLIDKSLYSPHQEFPFEVVQIFILMLAMGFLVYSFPNRKQKKQTQTT